MVRATRVTILAFLTFAYLCTHGAASDSCAGGEYSMLEGYPVRSGPSPIAGTGMFATRAIPTGEHILCIPFPRVIDRQAVFDAGFGPIVQRLFPVTPESMEKMGLPRIDGAGIQAESKKRAIDLLSLVVAKIRYDRGHDATFDAFYKYYAETLHFNASYVPMVWREGDATTPDESMADVPIYDFHRRPTVEARYDSFVFPQIIAAFPDLFGSKNVIRAAYSRDRYVHARTHVASRAYGAPVHGRGVSAEESGGVLIPGLDLFNHPPDLASSTNTTITGVPGKGLCITAHRDFREGEEIFSSYGAMQPLIMVGNYGFLPEIHPTRMILPVHLSKSIFAIPDDALALVPRTFFFHGLDKPDSHGTFLRKTDVNALVAFYRYKIARAADPGGDAVAVVRRAFCTETAPMSDGRTFIDFVSCGISKDNEIAARMEVRKSLMLMRSRMRYGSSAAVRERIATGRASMSGRAFLLNQARQITLDIIEGAIRESDEKARMVTEKLLDCVVLSPPVLEPEGAVRVTS